MGSFASAKDQQTVLRQTLEVVPSEEKAVQLLHDKTKKHESNVTSLEQNLDDIKDDYEKAP